jgi:hypothetical protein
LSINQAPPKLNNSYESLFGRREDVLERLLMILARWDTELFNPERQNNRSDSLLFGTRQTPILLLLPSIAFRSP